MSMYGDILKEKREAAKACPSCHRLMKKACIKGKGVWICTKCGGKVTEAGGQNESTNKPHGRTNG